MKLFFKLRILSILFNFDWLFLHVCIGYCQLNCLHFGRKCSWGILQKSQQREPMLLIIITLVLSLQIKMNTVFFPRFACFFQRFLAVLVFNFFRCFFSTFFLPFFLGGFLTLFSTFDTYLPCYHQYIHHYNTFINTSFKPIFELMVNKPHLYEII